MPGEAAAGGSNSKRVSVLDVHMPGDAGAIGALTDSVSDALSQLEVPEEKRMDIALAVQEALANAVVHGCENDPSKEVRCQLERDHDGRILITITDPGPGFPVSSAPNPHDDDKLYDGHGRGVYLIRQLMDEVQFTSGGNEIRMWKY